MTTDPAPADTWAELLEAVTHPDQMGWAKTLEPAVVLAAADPVLSQLFVEAAWDEIHVSVELPVGDEGRLPYLWPEAADFELRHRLERRIDEYGDVQYVIVRAPQEGDEPGAVAVSAPFPRNRWEEEWDELQRRWDAAALADPRYWVIDPAMADPLGRHLTPQDAVALWSWAVAGTLGRGRGPRPI